MARIYDTIRCWADGQNALNAAEPDRGAELQRAAAYALPRLQRHSALGDLAAAYYDDGEWWTRVAQEFELAADEAEVARNAAYWQRFMELRHPARSRAR